MALFLRLFASPRQSPRPQHALPFAKLVERVESLVQAVENPILAHNASKVMPLQVGLQVRLHVREHQFHAAIGQVLLQFPHHARRGVVDARGNRAGIHNHPAHRRRMRPHKPADLIRKPPGVGVEERRPENGR
jgi:hypothetical protein